ncbi:MAG TPA: hypothetical protein VLV55_09265, partial [Rhizomicrobium sp.]|nr:hypothetical protein [Rhizomicrobium sp.]
GMIGELHFHMKEVAFRSMCQAGDLGDRMDWVNATIRLAEAGAKVADSVTGLRSGQRPEGPNARSRAKR